ncbi:Uncharacterised protein [Mycobacterium tuberculosis]|nr:Uncharacterised protein [Mycobacterium tuberculosis]
MCSGEHSSKRPTTSKVGTAMSANRSTTSQSRTFPTMRKSLGPNIVSKISVPMLANASVSSRGQGRVRHR